MTLRSTEHDPCPIQHRCPSCGRPLASASELSLHLHRCPLSHATDSPLTEPTYPNA